MAKYLEVVDTDYIKKFAERMKRRWANQDKVDERFAGMYTKEGSIEVADRGTDDVIAISSGIAGQGIDQDVSLITVSPFLRVNSPDPDNDKLTRRINTQIEPWLAAVRKRAAVGPVEERQIGDMPPFGRGWSNVFPLPKIWSDNAKFKKLLKEYRDLVEGAGKEGDIKSARKDLELFRRDHFPIRHRYVDVRNTWPQLSDEVWLPEVVEIRKMTKGDIESNYDEMPGDIDEMSAEHEVEVLVYANWVFTATIINSRDDPKMVHKFEHGMGANPYILMEGPLMKSNSQGIRWKSSLWHIADDIEAYDSLMSDYMNNHRMNAITPRVWYHRDDGGETDPQLGGRPTPFKLKPNEDVNLWASVEKVELAPVPLIQPQAIQLLQEFQQRIDSAFLQPQLGGESKSGESNVLYNTRTQVADRRFQGYTAAIQAGAEQFGKLAFRCVIALNKDVPETDKVAAYSEKHGWLEVGPEDVDGLEELIQGRIDRTMPINMNQKYAMAQAAKTLNLPDSWIWPTILNIEDPEQVQKEQFLQAVDASLMEYAIQQIQIRAGVLLEAALEGQLPRQEEIAGLPPAFQQALGGLDQGMIPGNVMQGMANQRRDGVAEAPSVGPSPGIGPVA